MTEIGSHKKTNMYDSIYHLYKVPQVVTFTEPESPWWVPGAEGAGKRGVCCLNGYRVSALPAEEILDICFTTVDRLNTTELCTLQKS